MRRLGMTLILALFFPTLFAQNLTGKWKGYFIPNNDASASTYLYEMDIKENNNHQINAVTYTNLLNQFTAKAVAKGQHSITTQMVSIMETSFDKLKINTNQQACLMQNYLTYTNVEGYEILEGTYVSSNIGGGKNCGGGKVYLEKANAIVQIKVSTPTSKKISNTSISKETISKQTTSKQTISKQTASQQTISKQTNSKQSFPRQTLPTNQTILSKSASLSSSNRKSTNLKDASASNQRKSTNQPKEESLKTVETADSKIQTDAKSNIIKEPTNNENSSLETNLEPTKTKGNLQSIPWVLVGRENKLIKKIITNTKKFTLDFYDNGTIDNDTIMVFDNKQLMNSKQRLSYKAIHLEFEFTDSQNEHEVIIVAQNMGSVPPNTALMIFKEGKNRQDYFITTTDKMNAKLLVVYQAPDPN